MASGISLYGKTRRTKDCRAMDSPPWYGHHRPVPYLVAVACVRSLKEKPEESSEKQRRKLLRSWADYGQIQWNAPARTQPGGQAKNELSPANKAAGRAQITIADTTQKPTFNTRIAILLDNMGSSFRAPAVPT